MTSEKISKEHEIFYNQRDYDYLLAQFRREQNRVWSIEEQLIIAKAYFQNEDYDKCIGLLEQVSPIHSTKVLFQRQCLYFKAHYLLKRRQIPSRQLFKELYAILADFQKYKDDIRGAPFKAHHSTTIINYRKFVLYLEQHLKSKITYTQEMFRQQQEMDKRSHKKTGFPCYYVSTQWLSDFNKIIRDLDHQKNYINPITNFSILNDYFEAYQHNGELDSYKNVVVFPAASNRKIISKKLWLFYCSMFAGDNQFFPIKRIFSQKTHYYSNIEAVELVPAVIQCKNQMLVLQLTANELASSELLPIIEKKFGKGELKNPWNQEASFDIFYSGENIQKGIGDWKKVLIYQQIEVPLRLRKYHFFQHLDHRPLGPSVIEREGGLKGLQNLGNSCYLNACIQCISFTKVLTQQLVAKDLTQPILQRQDSREGVVTFALSDLLKRLWRNVDEKHVCPFKFKKYFGDIHTMFQGKNQQDGHEFLLQLLNALHEDVKLSPSRVSRIDSKLDVTYNVDKVRDYFSRHQLEENKSIIMDHFRGMLHTTILCNSCKTASHSFDVFLALSLPIPYVTYPTFKFYFTRNKAKLTYKYEICLKDISSFNEVFKVFKEEVLTPKHATVKSPKMQKESQDPKKMHYLLIAFSKEEIPIELWNCGAKNMLSNKHYLIQQLEALNRALIIYEVEEPADDERLVIVEYKLNPLIGRQKPLGIPRFLNMKESDIKGEKTDYKKLIIQNDNQNKLFQSDFKSIDLIQWAQQTGSIKFTLTAYFKREERLFMENSFVDRDLNTSADKYTLRDCFHQMGKPEILEDGWKCGNCHSNKGAEKKEYLTDTNNILIISLKRFQMNGNKIKNLIEYPVTHLNIAEWLQNTGTSSRLGNRFYDLYAVCLHQGTMQYGHYRAYCKHFVTGKWYQFDDEKVMEVDPDNIVSPNAYMLFYKLRDI